MLVILAVAAPSAAAKPITGKLSKSGYQVLALAADGTTVSVKAKPRFKIRPPAKRVTLQLRSKHGTYAGPIVIGRKRHGRRAIEGVVRGARLGRVRVRPAKGYAKVKGDLKAKWTGDKVRARARKGVPIGAGNFGYVRSAHTHGGVPGDRDIDGVPDTLDVDPNGDLVLGSSEPTDVGARSELRLDLLDTVNASALNSSGVPAFTDADIEHAFQSFGALILGAVHAPADPGTDVELDCGGQPNPDDPAGWIGGLSYCTRGGTGTLSGELNLVPPGGSVGDSFPECCDPDGDGMGSLLNDYGRTTWAVGLLHGARTDQVRAGDLPVVRFTEDGAPHELSGTLPFVYATVPALAAYSDAAGNCAKTPGTTGHCPNGFSYPVAPAGPGTEANPFPVAAGSDGDVSVTLTFWRPQRRSLPGEAGEWIDTGHTLYRASVGDPSHGFGGCPQDAYSTADPSLVPVPDLTALKDTSDDRPADPANTVSFTLNLTPCVGEASGFGLHFDPGDELAVALQAEPAFSDPAPVHNLARTEIWFKRVNG